MGPRPWGCFFFLYMIPHSIKTLNQKRGLFKLARRSVPFFFFSNNKWSPFVWTVVDFYFQGVVIAFYPMQKPRVGYVSQHNFTQMTWSLETIHLIKRAWCCYYSDQLYFKHETIAYRKRRIERFILFHRQKNCYWCYQENYHFLGLSYVLLDLLLQESISVIDVIGCIR